MSEIYTNARRAAEASRWGKAISTRAVRININSGKTVLAQVIFHKGDYALTYKGLQSVAIPHININEYVDQVKTWRPM